MVDQVVNFKKCPANFKKVPGQNCAELFNAGVDPTERRALHTPLFFPLELQYGRDGSLLVVEQLIGQVRRVRDGIWVNNIVL